MERVDKILAGMGLGSRKEIKALVKQGAVVINGVICKDPGDKIDVERDEVSVSGRMLRLRTTYTFMMHKPAGYLSASRDDRDVTVIELLSEEHRRLGLFPAGRLDKDSEGLLILTNDGPFAHALTAPRRHVDKLYAIRYDGVLRESAEAEFAAGIAIDGGETCLEAELCRTAPGEALVTVHEGRYHQVKRMIAACGGEVTYLKRLRIGPLPLDEGLLPGEYRELTDGELSALRAACGIDREESR